jgi:hypothetical protein
MGLKFYLNKYAKVDNIENYNLSTLKILQGEYTRFLEESDGVDPDFPMFNFGGGKGELAVKGKNKAALEDNLNSEQ